MAEETDDLNTRGQLWMDKAEVLSVAGNSADAAACLERAVDLLERKGNVVGAQTARGLLAELQQAAPPG